MPGFFVSFEGIDKSGKSTQAGHLAANLKMCGYDVVMTREPGGTELGKEIRELVLHGKNAVDATAEMFLFAADRAQHVAEVIRPALDAGKVVISDRYVDSTLAYQGYGRGLALARLKTVQAIATVGLMPDVTFWVDVDLKTSRNRAEGEKNDRMESGDDAFYERIRAGFGALLAESPARFVHVDGSRPVDEVSAKILKVVKDRLASEQTASESV